MFCVHKPRFFRYILFNIFDDRLTLFLVHDFCSLVDLVTIDPFVQT